MKITLDDGEIVHKVGMCRSARSNERMMEILYGFFKQYRYVPRCELRRDKKVLIPHLVEKHMHRLLEEYSYRFDKKFDGSTEFFRDLDEDVLLDYLDSFTYNILLQVDSLSIDEYESISKAIKIDSKEPRSDSSDKLPF